MERSIGWIATVVLLAGAFPGVKYSLVDHSSIKPRLPAMILRLSLLLFVISLAALALEFTSLEWLERLMTKHSKWITVWSVISLQLRCGSSG
ncbi:MAG: hypothetical protein RLY14_2700 [Planctomycetota bacterium]|jgi:hypothetical protein